MTPWRVTHINLQHRRHVMHVLAADATQAEARLEALYGPALYCACINLARQHSA